jgi:hypothetical protein
MPKTLREYTATMPVLRRALGKFDGGAPAAAVALNIPVRRLRSYRDGHCEVPSATLAAMVKLFGASFLNDWLSEHGLHLTATVAADEICPREANASIAKLNHKMADNLVDGRVDHIEAAETVPIADAAVVSVTRLAKTLRKVRAAA